MSDEQQISPADDGTDDVEAHGKLGGTGYKGAYKGATDEADGGDDVEAHGKLGGTGYKGYKGATASDDDDVSAHMKGGAPGYKGYKG
jgi:hypothetical protein